MGFNSGFKGLSCFGKITSCRTYSACLFLFTHRLQTRATLMLEVTRYCGKHSLITLRVVTCQTKTIFIATTVRRLKFRYGIFKNEEYEEYDEMVVVLRIRFEGTVCLLLQNRSLVSNIGRKFQP